MKITHDDLRHAYKSHIKSCVPPSREACPPAEKIFNVFDESVSPADKEKVIDHVTRCCYCLREYELFLEFHRKEEKAIGDIAGFFQRKGIRSRISGKKPTAWGSLWGLMVKPRTLWRFLAASLFAVSIIGFILIGVKSFLRAPEDKERGRPPGQVHLIAPVRGQKLEKPQVFRWERISMAEYYQLEIFDEALLPIWKSPQMKDDHYEFPPGATNIFRKSGVYFWTITTWFIDGTKRESSLEEFTLK